MHEALQNVKISDRTEFIGVEENPTKKPLNTRKTHKSKCNCSIRFFRIKLVFGIMWFEHMTFCSQSRHATNCAIYRLFKRRWRKKDLNLQLTDYDSVTLPIELYRLGSNRTWTDNFVHAKHTLYQLSYTPVRTMRFELIQSAWKAENLPLIYIRGLYIQSQIFYVSRLQKKQCAILIT